MAKNIGQKFKEAAYDTYPWLHSSVVQELSGAAYQVTFITYILYLVTTVQSLLKLKANRRSVICILESMEV